MYVLNTNMFCYLTILIYQGIVFLIILHDKVSLNQPSTESLLLMHQQLRSDISLSHPNVSSGFQYSQLR